MSEDFDREEEKRKLREKYAKDRKDREATGRMSELLLQGATMTNKHCDRCGSPIFRYQGESFCPTCSAEGAQQEQQQSGELTEQPAQTAEQQTQTADHSPTQAESSTQQPEPVERPTQQPATTSQSPEQVQPTNPPAPTSDSASEPSDAVENAKNALADTITTLAQRARNTDDPRQAKEYLDAAHDAAETLEKLD